MDGGQPTDKSRDEAVGGQRSDLQRQLLQRILSGDVSLSGGKVAAISSRGPCNSAPLSPEQRQLWLHAQLASKPIYNESVTIHRMGAFDLQTMERTFNEIVRRHEIWRTSFDVVNGEARQIVHSELDVRLQYDDLTSLSPEEQEAEAQRLAIDDARREFDLSSAPLFRVRVTKFGDREHRLYLALHHIIFDGISLARVLLPELAEVYDAFAQGKASPLREPLVQYGDYASWKERAEDDNKIAEKIEFWRNAIGASAPQLSLAADHDYPPIPSYQGGVEKFGLPLLLTEALQDLARAEETTLYTVLLAAFKTMLSRYSGSGDILIGGVTDQRQRPELEKLIGLFLNPIAIRTRPSADLSFREYLAQVRTTVLSALHASDLSFERVSTELNVARQPGAHPLFQAVFSMQPLAEPYPAGWDLTQMDIFTGNTKFDLYLEMEMRPEGLVGRIIYSRDLFERGTVRRMIGHLQTLLEGVVSNADSPLGQLPLLTASEMQELLLDWNETDLAVSETTVHGWFRSQAQRAPDSIAIMFEGRSWTYRELVQQSDAVASRLQKMGVGPEVLVGLYMNRSPEMVAGLLGILKTGGAFVPLDPALPRSRLDFIVNDAKPAVLLADRELLSRLPAGDIPVVSYDTCSDSARFDSGRKANGSHLAYILYTSGSTGHPKGAEIEHAALVNLLRSMQRKPGFAADDSLLALATIGFDLSVYELLLPLVSGGRLVIAPREVASDPRALAELIGASRCTVIAATPATWRALIEEGWSGDASLSIICCGEALARGLAQDLLRRCKALWNGYGPTETTIFSTIHQVLSVGGSVPIGRPIANVKHYILDANENPMPVGAIGELYIGGAGLARGYRNRPDLTSERFVGLGAVPGQRLYKTGDLARYRADGTIEYCGRADSEEKIRGYRVAVEEVEAALVRHPDIAAAAVRAWPDASGNKALVAYLVTLRRELAQTELRQFLSESLPDFMIPSRFTPIAELPMTPTGKIDRKSLPPVIDFGPAMVSPPKGETEERLATIWRDILGTASVGRRDNFFDLGGHSLLVAKFLREVDREFGRKLTMATFFRAPTIEAMARLLGEEPLHEGYTAIPVQPAGSRPPLLWLDGGPLFRGLASAIGLDQPFLGIPVDPVLERHAASPMSFEDIASVIADGIKELQPEGPYYLGGWCNMGILAYEVASQLKRAGHKVGLVILLDAPNPVSYGQIGRMPLIWSQLRFHWPRFWRQSKAEKKAYLSARVRGLLKTFKILPSHSNTHQGQLRAELSRMISCYDPPIYSGDVALIQPSPRLDVYDFEAGWAGKITGKLESYDVPGTHVSMLSHPYVQQLGTCLETVLLRAQEAATANRVVDELQAA